MRKCLVLFLLCFCILSFSVAAPAQKHVQISTSLETPLEDYLKKALPEKLKQNPAYIKKLAGHLKQVSLKYNIPVKTLVAFVLVESTGNHKAKNGACIGLTQINYPIWEKALKKAKIVKRRSDLYKPAIAIEACAFVYTHYKEKSKSKKHIKAVMAYAGGSKKYYKKLDYIEKHYLAYIRKPRKDEKS